MKKIAFAAIALAGLVSCGPLNEGSAARGFLGVAQSWIGGQGAGGNAAAPQPISRAQIDANPGGFILVRAYGGTGVAMMVKLSSSAGRDTWISEDSVTVTLENGIIVATRGFRRDLIAAEANGVRRAIAVGSGSATRVHETIDDLDQISTEVLQCSIASEGSENVNILGKTAQTRRVKETCLGESLSFTNTYWVDGAGGILRSQQAIAPSTGFIQVDRL